MSENDAVDPSKLGTAPEPPVASFAETGTAVIVAPQGPVRRRTSLPFVLVLGLALLVSGYLVIRKTYPFMFVDSKTYDVFWQAPDPWIKVPRSPMTLFLYKHPLYDVHIRGFQYHVDAEMNVDPDLDADALADYYLQTTKENQLNWTGKRAENVEGGDIRFTMIERTREGKVVFTAFGQRGNTMVGAALYGGGAEVQHAREALPFFREFLKRMALRPAKGRAGGTELPAGRAAAFNR
jgi:hypothetical protein